MDDRKKRKKKMNIESNVVIELLELERWLINKNDRLFEFPSTSIKLECLLVLLLHTHLNEISVNSINKKHQSCCCNRSEYDGGCILRHLHFIHYRFFVSFLKCWIVYILWGVMIWYPCNLSFEKFEPWLTSTNDFGIAIHYIL